MIIALFVFLLQRHQRYLEAEVEKTSEKVKNDELLAKEMTDVLPIIAFQTVYDDKFTPVFLSRHLENVSGYPVSDYMNGKRFFF